MGQKKRVAVLGGGVGGLTAAHELAERGYAVTVYEKNAIFGGKARSVVIDGSGQDGRRDLPAEHGFRFFPGFYRHLPDTMKRIPFAGNDSGVAGNLVSVRHIQLARAGDTELHFLVHMPRSKHDISHAVQALVDASDVDISPVETAFFASRLFYLLGCCAERRETEIERISWWDFIDAANRSENYRRYFGRGLTRTLVAMRAEEGSARTVGYILLQILFDILTPGRSADHVLNGPTNDVWIDPWTRYLGSLGVKFETDARAKRLELDGSRVARVVVERDGREGAIEADHFVSALPVEAMRALVDEEIVRRAPSLATLDQLKTEWMNGVMFYLDRDVHVVHGHSLFVDSPWALTSISQRQFWRGVDFKTLGDGRVKGILSVDVSDWETPGILYGKPASRCTAEQIKNEVWAQIKAHINDQGAEILDDAGVVRWFIDPSIVFVEPDRPVNREPLLVNTAGSLAHRPNAWTEIENLVLAADYVRTHTDLATMEGANEAARRAVNAILERERDPSPHAAVWPLREPFAFAPLRAIDRVRFKARLPNALLGRRTP